MIFTIPNLLSLLRLLLIPVYMTLYLKDPNSILAPVILGISCITDLLDGIIARRFQMVSFLGKFLDPLADKMTQLSLIYCLSSRYPLVKALVPLFLTKEILQCVLAYHHFIRGKMLPGALWIGKLSTAGLFLSFILMMLKGNLPFIIVEYLVLGNGLMLAIALGSYLSAFLGDGRKLCDT